MNLERLILFLTVLAMSRTLINAKPAKRHGKDHQKKIKKARIEAIKTDILRKLGLNHVPRIKSVNATIEEKRRVIKMYKKRIDESSHRYHELYPDEEYTAKNFYYFTDYGSPLVSSSSARNSSRVPTRLYFDVDIPQPDDPKKELAVHKGELKLFKTSVMPEYLKDETNADRTISVNVYQILKRPKKKKKKNIRKLIDSKVINLAYLGWEHFNIKEAVSYWLNNPKSNYGIEIESDAQDLHDVVTFAKGGDHYEEELDSEDVSPSLTVLTSEKLILGKSKRRKVKEDCIQGDGEKKCCRYPLYISFKEIGWDDWVIEPAGYNAYYCDGKCPRRYKMAHTFSGIKSILKMTNPAASPSVCCTATKLSPLPLLHLDEHGHYGVTEYSDMIVEECKCA